MARSRTASIRAAALRSLAVLALLMCVASVQAQCSSYTTVTGTIVDADGVPYSGDPYSGGRVTADLFPPGATTPTCAPASGGTRPQFSTHIGPTPLGTDGSFSISLPPNSIITPSGTQWTITINENTGALTPFGTGSQAFTYTVTINAGGPQDLTVALNARAHLLTVPFCNPTLMGQTGCGAGAGCAVGSLLDTWVVSIHPAATCYGSIHFTWDDSTGAQNLQAGLSNTLGTGGSQIVLGNSNSSCTSGSTCSDIFLAGNGNDAENLSSPSAVANNHYLIGNTNSTDGNLVNAFTLGYNNGIDQIGSGTSQLILCLLNGCDHGSGGMNGENGGTINTSINAGLQNLVVANGSTARVAALYLYGEFNFDQALDTSIITSIYHFGEDSSATAQNASEVQDCYTLGGTPIGTQPDNCTANGSGDYNGQSIDAGFNNSVAVTGTSTNLKYTFDVGHGNTISASSGTVHDIGALGDTLTLSNCTVCYSIGHGYSNTTSSSIDIGLSATPEIQVTPGSVVISKSGTATNCASAASPAVCGSAAAGNFVVAASATSVIVDTSAVTANSQIFVQPDASLSARLSVTCNTTGSLLASEPWISARSAGVSFTVSLNAAPSVNPECFSYQIVN